MLKAAGQEQALAGVEASYEEWRVAFEAELVRRRGGAESFTSEDITEVVGLYRESEQNSAPGKGNPGVGALMAKAAKEGLIWQCGWAHARNPRSHGAMLAVWRGKR